MAANDAERKAAPVRALARDQRVIGEFEVFASLDRLGGERIAGHQRKGLLRIFLIGVEQRREATLRIRN
jgi:hypothetical protein